MEVEYVHIYKTFTFGWEFLRESFALLKSTIIKIIF